MTWAKRVKLFLFGISLGASLAIISNSALSADPTVISSTVSSSTSSTTSSNTVSSSTIKGAATANSPSVSVTNSDICKSAGFSGAVQTRKIYTVDRHADPDEDIALQLRCDELACLLVLQRRFSGHSRIRQALLARGQPESYWTETLQAATAALYQP